MLCTRSFQHGSYVATVASFLRFWMCHRVPGGQFRVHGLNIEPKDSWSQALNGSDLSAESNRGQSLRFVHGNIRLEALG